jgi:hypothetical protein
MEAQYAKYVNRTPICKICSAHFADAVRGQEADNHYSLSALPVLLPHRDPPHPALQDGPGGRGVYQPGRQGQLDSPDAWLGSTPPSRPRTGAANRDLRPQAARLRQEYLG